MPTDEYSKICEFYAKEGLPLLQKPETIVSPLQAWPAAAAWVRINDEGVQKLLAASQKHLGRLPVPFTEENSKLMGLGDAYGALRLAKPPGLQEHHIIISPNLRPGLKDRRWFLAREAFYVALHQHHKLYDLFPFEPALAQYAAGRLMGEHRVDPHHFDNFVWSGFVLALDEIVEKTSISLSDLYEEKVRHTDIWENILAASQKYCRSLGLPTEDDISAYLKQS